MVESDVENVVLRVATAVRAFTEADEGYIMG